MAQGTPRYHLLLLIALAASFSTLLTGMLYITGQANELRQTLYHRCVVRENYDEASQSARVALRDWLQDYVSQESANRFIDEKLRQERIVAAQKAVTQLDRTVQVGAPVGCNKLL